MDARISAVALSMVLLLALSLVPLASHAQLEEARRRAIATFDSGTLPGGLRAPIRFNDVAVDQAKITQPWLAVPFDQAAYTYSYQEIEAKWPLLMRGLRFPFPSPSFLKSRYEAFPAFRQTLRYGDDDWQMHSYNTLEVWQAFFRGDFRLARDQGRYYGGYSLIPALFAQIMYAQYLAPSYELRQMLLQDAITQMQDLAQLVPIALGEEAFVSEYVLLRMGFSYAVGRLAEYMPVIAGISQGHAQQMVNAAAEALAADPEHPFLMALNGAFDANVIRRLGSIGGRLTMANQLDKSRELFAEALRRAPDQPVVRLEYANSLLYVEQGGALQEAIKHLSVAEALPALYSMEALDALYAKKRLREIQAFQRSGVSFRAFDRERRRHMERSGENLYSVMLPPFLVK